MTDYQYEDCDDNGLPVGGGQSIPNYRKMNDITYKDLLFEIFGITGNRKYFGNASEKKKWKQICKGLDNKSIPLEWIRNCIDYVKRENTKAKGYAVPFTFYRVENMILNASRMKDYLASKYYKRMEGTIVEINSVEEVMDIDDSDQTIDL